MKINSKTLGITMFILIFAGIGITMLLGIWSTTTDKEPAKFEELGLEGQYNPADIRGSYTFDEISDLFKIDSEILRKAFKLGSNIDLTELTTGNLETLYVGSDVEIGNGSVKLFVALYLNLPYTMEDDYLPSSAVDLIKQNNKKLSQEQLDYLELHTVDINIATNQNVENNSSNESTTEEAVNGNTTFMEIMNLGITEEQIKSILNDDMPPSNMSIKDYCDEKGIGVSDLKEKFNELILE
jgi:hypothetical protein